MTSYYDTIAKQYQQFHESPQSRYLDVYTYFNLLGELAGKSILDLGCGEGFYTRMFQRQGSTKVIRVDISPEMIFLARQEELREPLGIEYIVADLCELGFIDHFDLVVASYVLNCAQTKEQLLKMCQTIFVNLKLGGRFVGLNNNVEQSPDSYPICQKYGLTKSVNGELGEGKPITLTFSVGGEKFSLIDYYLSKETYEWAFRTAGFKEVRWHSPMVSAEGIEEFGSEFCVTLC